MVPRPASLMRNSIQHPVELRPARARHRQSRSSPAGASVGLPKPPANEPHSIYNRPHLASLMHTIGLHLIVLRPAGARHWYLFSSPAGAPRWAAEIHVTTRSTRRTAVTSLAAFTRSATQNLITHSQQERGTGIRPHTQPTLLVRPPKPFSHLSGRLAGCQ
jgi:hypothetical protein